MCNSAGSGSRNNDVQRRETELFSWSESFISYQEILQNISHIAHFFLEFQLRFHTEVGINFRWSYARLHETDSWAHEVVQNNFSSF